MEILDRIDSLLENRANYKMAIAELEKITEEPIVHPMDNVWFKTIRQISQKWANGESYTVLLSMLVEWWERNFHIKTNWPKQ